MKTETEKKLLRRRHGKADYIETGTAKQHKAPPTRVGGATATSRPPFSFATDNNGHGQENGATCARIYNYDSYY